MHAKSQRFRRTKERSFRVIDDALSGRRLSPMLCALSGGKDSVAMAGLLEELGADCQSEYVHCKLTLPETLETVEATVEMLGMDLVIVEPDPEHMAREAKRLAEKYGTALPVQDGYDEWDLLRVLPADKDIIDLMPEIDPIMASGSLGIAYQKASGAAGAFVGMRAEESHGRHMNFAARGEAHCNQKDGLWTVCPVAWWKVQDVYAYLFSRDLPIHPYYKKAVDRIPSLDPNRVRVDMAVPMGQVAALGAVAVMKIVYPEFFRALARVRPEIAMYA